MPAQRQKIAGERRGDGGHAAAPQAAARDARDEADAAARAYWALWRLNWRAPFPPDDRPAAGADGRGGRAR